MLYLILMCQFSVRVMTQPVPEPDNYLVVFSASWCQPCHTWERTQKSEIVAAGFKPTAIDVDKTPQWNSQVDRVPTFWIVDRKTRKVLKRFTGATSAKILLKELNTQGVSLND